MMLQSSLTPSKSKVSLLVARTRAVAKRGRKKNNRCVKISSAIIMQQYPCMMVHDPQALVYDILPSTTAVFSYAIGSRKLLTNEQFFVGAQTVVRLLQTTQIKQGVSFIAANKVYTSTNKTTIV